MNMPVDLHSGTSSLPAPHHCFRPKVEGFHTHDFHITDTNDLPSWHAASRSEKCRFTLCLGFHPDHGVWLLSDDGETSCAFRWIGSKAVGLWGAYDVACIWKNAFYAGRKCVGRQHSKELPLSPIGGVDKYKVARRPDFPGHGQVF